MKTSEAINTEIQEEDGDGEVASGDAELPVDDIPSETSAVENASGIVTGGLIGLTAGTMGMGTLAAGGLIGLSALLFGSEKSRASMATGEAHLPSSFEQNQSLNKKLTSIHDLMKGKSGSEIAKKYPLAKGFGQQPGGKVSDSPGTCLPCELAKKAAEEYAGDNPPPSADSVAGDPAAPPGQDGVAKETQAA